jgi:hypothetical protein
LTTANLVQAKENPSFGMYNAWTELGDYDTLKNSISDGSKQPETITNTFAIGSNPNVKEHKVFVIPDQGKFGIDWTLVHNYSDYVKKVLPCLAEHEEPRFQAKPSNYGVCWFKAMLSPHGVWSLPNISTPMKRRTQRMLSKKL